MKHREFFALIGLAATAQPLAARAQQRDRTHRLGVLMGNHSNDPVGQVLAAALVQGLGALDWYGMIISKSNGAGLAATPHFSNAMRRSWRHSTRREPAEEATLLRNLLHNFRLAWKFPRWRWAILIAVLSDALGFTVVLFPPMEWLLDGATAIVLFGVLGFRWPLLAALVTEAVPGLQLFPAWTLVVLALAATQAERSERGY